MTVLRDVVVSYPTKRSGTWGTSTAALGQPPGPAPSAGPGPKWLPARARAPLVGHRAVEPLAVDGDVARAGQVLDEVERHAEGVPEAERLASREPPGTGFRFRERRLETRQAVGEHLVELGLLLADHGDDRVAARHQLRIGRRHPLDDDLDEVMQERLRQSELLAVAHGAPHDLPQHVPAPFVRWHDAVANQERHRAQMVGDDPQRDVARVVGGASRERAVEGAGALADGRQQWREEVRVVVRQLVLENGDDPLQPHPGVDRRRRERRQGTVRLPLELHEHVVPDLDVAVACAVDAATRSARRTG